MRAGEMRVAGILATLLTLAAASAWAVEDAARVAFVGDVMLAETEGTGRLAAHGGDPLAQVRRLLSDADLRVANFESSAGTKGKPDPEKPFSFRTAQSALIGFASVFEAAGLANNHAGDFGREDFVETLTALRKAGATTFGGGKDPSEAHRAAIFERHGVRIALLGYLDFFPRWFSAAPGKPGVAWLDEDQAALDIAQARADGADVVVVIPHWGTEHEPRANVRQRRIARALLDVGADAVIGGHPHVVQDYEIYQGKPIVYSLGNFVFDGFEEEDNVTGWALFANFDKKGVSSIMTRVVRMDANGSPAPEPSKAGPCWQRGEADMSVCKKP
jgi:poly-gamma-glutamate synthesis protein (capsule biosynthesis protein)